MALIRDAIRIDGWARAQHRDHTDTMRPEWCPLCHSPEPEPPSPAAPGARPTYRQTPAGIVTAWTYDAAKCQECGGYAATEQCAAPTCPQGRLDRRELEAERRMYPTAEAYIRGIRNAAKRAYAEAYARHMRHEGPQPERGALSYMAAQAVRMHLTSLGVTPPRLPRPRYRLTPEGLIPCSPDDAPALPCPVSATVAVANSPASCAITDGAAASAITTAPTAPAPRTGSRTTRATAPRAARKTRGAGAYAGLLDRLEAIGATFCPECYAYQWPDHPTHLTRGPIVPLGTVTLAEPCVVDGLDGQSELVTIQEREAA